MSGNIDEGRASRGGKFVEALTELFAAIQTARQDARESHLSAPNSYGAGYDAGYRDALIRAHKEFSEIPEIEDEETMTHTEGNVRPARDLTEAEMRERLAAESAAHALICDEIAKAHTDPKFVDLWRDAARDARTRAASLRKGAPR